MANRPYFKKSIAELEALFAKQSSDVTVLTDLKAELVFRSTPRAKKLEDKVSKVTKNPSISKPKKEHLHSSETATKTTLEFPSAPPTKEEIKKTTLKRSDIGPKPAVSNAPQNILGAWTALEVLSPQGYHKL